MIFPEEKGRKNKDYKTKQYLLNLIKFIKTGSENEIFEA